MHRSTSYLRLCLSFALLGGVVHAQPVGAPQGPGPSSTVHRGEQQPTAAQRVDRLNAALNLSSDQKSAALSLLENLQTELTTLKSSGALPRAASGERAAFINTTAGQVRALLSESQQTAFDAMRPEQRAQIFGR